MAWPNVGVNQLNQQQGETTEVERVALFVGRGMVNTGKTLPVNSQSDLDVLLGEADSDLKRLLSAARDNAGQNWWAFVRVLADAEKWTDAVQDAQQVASVEGVVLCDAIAEKAVINEAATLRSTLIAKYGRWVWFILAVQSMQTDEAQADYLARLSALQDGVSEKAVCLVPVLWGNEPGVLAGRLCNRAVTIADSPARVKTGPLVSMGSDALPVDGDGVALQLATLQALEAQRFSVPMWYADYDGYYWSDCRTLDAEGGDYQALETVRIVDKVARRVRLLAIAKIADRALNSSPGSIAANQLYFARPLREMSKSSEINGVQFPGEVKSPKDGDVTIVWQTRKKVEVYVVIRPYEMPLEITINLMLDASLEGGA